MTETMYSTKVQRQVLGWTSFCLAGAVLALGCSPTAGDLAQEQATPPNVILVCMDTVRADHLGCYGYERNPTTPAIDRLAASSSVFLDTSATACWTKPSVPSFLTGTFPIQHGAYLGDSKARLRTETDTLPQAANTLAEAFQAAGYRTGGFVRNAQLRKGLGFEQGFDVYVDEAGDAREIRWQATDWLDDGEPQEPFFLYLHFLDAHWPYPVPEEYAGLFAEAENVAAFQSKDWRELRKAVNDGDVKLSDEQLLTLIDLYDGSIRYIDDQLGRLFAKLEREGLAENTVICVISDHGEEFLEHGRIGHGHGLHEELLQVPFVLYVPGLEPSEVTNPCSLVDLYPTLLGAAGLEFGAGLPGVNLLESEGEERLLFAEHLGPRNYQQAWRSRMRKVLRECRPGPLFDEARKEADSDELSPDLRWEVGIGIASDGSMVATRVRPREDEDPGEDLEIKGPIDQLAPTLLVVNGVEIHADEAMELYGETANADGSRRVLQVGDLVKVRCETSEQGPIRAARVKLYEPGAPLEREIRGPFLGKDNQGRSLFGGVLVAFDDSTAVEQPGKGSKPRFGRQDVLDMVGSETDPGETGLYSWKAWTHDLSERLSGPVLFEDAEMSPEWARYLQLQSQWAAERCWSASDSVVLTNDDLEKLRAIGYAE